MSTSCNREHKSRQSQSQKRRIKRVVQWGATLVSLKPCESGTGWNWTQDWWTSFEWLAGSFIKKHRLTGVFLATHWYCYVPIWLVFTVEGLAISPSSAQNDTSSSWNLRHTKDRADAVLQCCFYRKFVCYRAPFLITKRQSRLPRTLNVRQKHPRLSR